MICRLKKSKKYDEIKEIKIKTRSMVNLNDG